LHEFVVERDEHRWGTRQLVQPATGYTEDVYLEGVRPKCSVLMQFHSPKFLDCHDRLLLYAAARSNVSKPARKMSGDSQLTHMKWPKMKVNKRMRLFFTPPSSS
jgi:hypothetical protein